MASTVCSVPPTSRYLVPLKRYWGYDSFRPSQEQIVRALDVDQDAHPMTTRDAVEVPRLAAFEDAEFRRFEPAGGWIIPVHAVIEQPAVARQVRTWSVALLAPLELQFEMIIAVFFKGGQAAQDLARDADRRFTMEL